MHMYDYAMKMCKLAMNIIKLKISYSKMFPLYLRVVLEIVTDYG